MKKEWKPLLTDMLTHLFFPPVCPGCGRTVGKQEIFCPVCQKQLHLLRPGDTCPRCGKIPCICDKLHPLFTQVYPAGLYEGSIQSAIRNLKFQHQPGHFRPLGRLLANTLGRYHVTAADFDLLAAVPMSRKRQKARGYNQAALLAQSVSEQTGIPFCSHALTKIRETKAQHDLSAQMRRTNLKGSFIADSAVSGKRVLLVDDVFTTGSTANEAAEVMLQAGAISVDVLVLASTRFETL